MIDGNTLLTGYARGKKIVKRAGTFKEAEAVAESIGRSIVRLLGDTDFTDVSPSEIEAALLPVLKRAFGDASGIAASVQQKNLRRLGLGLNALSADFDAASVQAISEQLAGRAVEAKFIENMLAKEIVSAVDDTIRKNAEANADMGLEVHITRIYDDVGLRAGTKYAEPCAWCLAREGEWDSYEDAQKAGAFERHEGCKCIIDYDVKRTHLWSDQKGVWYTT